MRITITGGSGFLGTDLARALIDKGHTVTILDRETPDTSIANRVSFIEGDIVDHASVEVAVQRADLVYHVAALVPITTKRYKDFYAVNVEGTRTLLTAASAVGARVVFLSTSSPLFDGSHLFPVTETTPRTPGYAYGRSKYAAEAVCEEFRAQNTPIAIVRPRMLLGPGRLGLIEILSEWIRQGEPVPILGDGSNKLQFLDVADLTQFLTLLIEAPPELFNQDYNLGTTRFGTLHEDLSSLIAVAKSTSPIVPIPRWYRPLLALGNMIAFTPLTFFHLNTIDRTFYFDTTKAQKLLGWKPVYSNAESLIRSYEWYIKNRDHLSIGNSHNRKLKRIGLLSILPILLHIYVIARNFYRTTLVRIATGFGIGSVRIAPSSHGALLGMTAVPFFVLLSPFAQIVALVVGGLFAVHVASVAEKELGTKDDRRIVIDEMYSVFLTFFLFPMVHLALVTLIVGFFLNRVFDVLKPFPTRLAERLPRGWGIVGDDVISALYAWGVLKVIVLAL